jgi:ferredoxin
MSEATPATPHPADELLHVAETVHAGEVSVAFRPGPTVLAKVGAKLLDIAEASQVPMESGCRMGMCGSDPVRILEGEENLSAMRSAERRTLERLGLAAGCRMACVSRVQGPVVVDPKPALAASESEDDEPQRLLISVDDALQRTIRQVVVVGAGVGGVTAAEGLRQALPDAGLALIGEEPYAFYNRMAITRLVSESVSIESLYLNRRDWAESRRIDYRRGVSVTVIDRATSAGRGAAKFQSGEILSIAGTALAPGVERRHPIVCHDTRAGGLPYDSVLAKAGVGSYVVLPLFHGGRFAATRNVGFATAGAPTPSVVGLLSSLTASVMPTVLNLLTLEEQEHAIRGLEQFDALKDEFLASITHDMRTPVTIINGFAERLQDRWSELPDAEKLGSVDAILRNGRHTCIGWSRTGSRSRDSSPADSRMSCVRFR